MKKETKNSSVIFNEITLDAVFTYYSNDGSVNQITIKIDNKLYYQFMLVFTKDEILNIATSLKIDERKLDAVRFVKICLNTGLLTAKDIVDSL